MAVSDFIADQLTVVRNAIMRNRSEVIVRRSSLLEGIFEILKKEGFVEDFQTIEDNQQGKIKLYLKMDSEGKPTLEQLKKISTRSHF